MKLKIIAIAATSLVALTEVSNAVTLSIIGVANTSLGLVTLNSVAVPTGRAIFVTTTTDITLTANAALASLLGPRETPLSVADFNTTLATLIGTTSATSPGILLDYAMTGGLIAVNTPRDVGNSGNIGTLFITSESGGNVLGFGAYGRLVAPATGSMVFNPTTLNTNMIGTSTTGFQLAPVVVAIPEPSAALLGAIGVLGLLRRRRI
jgi:hypothetical protein